MLKLPQKKFKKKEKGLDIMKMHDIIQEKANLLTKGKDLISKAATYAFKPQGKYATNADLKAAQTAQKTATTAQTNLAATKDAMAKAQTDQQIAKLQKLVPVQKQAVKDANTALKTAPKPQFTTGQNIVRKGAGTSTAVGTGYYLGKPGTPDPADSEEQPTSVAQPNVSQYTELEPEDDEFDDLDQTNENIENIVSILKLSGQRAITERDNTVGIIKPKQIKTLTESAQVAECGGMMPNSGTSSQPATLNISATASSGDEVANMLKSIMQLAGVKPVEPNMMPQSDMLPIVKPTQVLGKPLEDRLAEIEASAAESMHNVEEGACGDCGGNPCECAMEETYDNTPEERVEPYDPNNMAHVINKVSSKDLASTPYQSASNPLSEAPVETKKVDEDVYHGLFKAYQEFKNSQ
jgi:hypothetical protein